MSGGWGAGLCTLRGRPAGMECSRERAANGAPLRLLALQRPSARRHCMGRSTRPDNPPPLPTPPPARPRSRAPPRAATKSPPCHPPPARPRSRAPLPAATSPTPSSACVRSWRPTRRWCAAWGEPSGRGGGGGGLPLPPRGRTCTPLPAPAGWVTGSCLRSWMWVLRA